MMNEPDRSITEIATEVQPTCAVQEEVMETNPSRGMNWFMILIVAAAMIPWVFGDYQIIGFNITGWSWVIPMAAACMICLGKIGRIAFPVGLWLTWVGIICLYWLFGRQNPDALQSLLQMLSPLAVGCATSSFRLDSLQLESVIRWITRLTWIVWILLLIRMPLILTGVLPGHGFMAAEMIGLLLLGACYASFYACGSGRHLYYYLAMLAITAISLTRGPIVAMLSCLPLTPASLTIRKRILLCVGIAICALILFNSDRVQKVMFYSASGGLTDLYWDNPNFQTSGRSLMFDILWPGVEDSPLLGNGFNTHRTALLNARTPTYLPHNDWLKLLYDIGFAGAGLYLITMVLQMFYLVRIARRSTGAQQMLAYGAATVFVPYTLIMLTDNVMLYVQFFGNLHFALIGIVYGAWRRDEEAVDV
jgi:hypothetical protein